MTADRFKMRLQAGLVLAVILWGIYLAVGAVLYNADYRKGMIMLGCTAGFIGLWASAFFVASKRNALSNEQPGGDGQAATSAASNWNFASAFGFLLAAASSGAMAAAAFGGWKAPKWAFVMILSAGVASAIASIVGLSNPVRRLGKWLGLVAIGLLFAGFVFGFYV